MNKETINTFDGGLVMDLNPMTTPNNVLVGCLNGTLVTFNGNENVLLNDMGNGRVETANLPEGYIPIGTCSHGGFIYIVSYNPLKNLALIGSFPSPERNIDSTELSDRTISLKEEEMYLEDIESIVVTDESLTEDELIKYKPLKPLLRKEFEDIILNPGDKFIVFANDLLTDNLSDYGNINHIIGTNPKLWKIRIASLEESGKVTELENLKWYKNSDIQNGSKSSDYYIDITKGDLSNRGDEPINVDDYRSLVNSPYSIFTPKKSGNLCLLISPEYVDTFTSTISIYGGNKGEYLVFFPYINSFWEHKNSNVSPDGILILRTGLDSNGNPISGYHPVRIVFNLKQDDGDIYNREITDIYPEYIEDDGITKKTRTYSILYKGEEDPRRGATIKDLDINYIFKKDVSYTSKNLEVTVKSDDKGEYNYPIIKYEIYPYNESGYFYHLKNEITIDYSKVGKDLVNILGFKYYVEKDSIIINLNLEAYTLLNSSIDKLWFEFYNDKGVAAYKVFSGLSSYNGLLSTRLNLDTSSEYYGLTYKDPVTGNVGENYDNTYDIPLYVNIDDYKINGSVIDGYYIKDDKIYKYNPIIAKDSLYLVKIRYTTKKLSNFNNNTSSTESSTVKELDYRWLWTTLILNSKYNEVDDFKDVLPELLLTSVVNFSTTNNYKEEVDILKDYSIAEFDLANKDASVGNTILTITGKNPNDSNIQADIYTLFENNYNDTFLIETCTNKVFLGDSNTSSSDKKLIQEDSDITVNEDNISSGIVNNSVGLISKENYDGKDFNYISSINLDTSIITKGHEYTEASANDRTSEGETKICWHKALFKVLLRHESKYLVSGKEETKELPLCKSVISEKDDFAKYNLTYSPTNISNGYNGTLIELAQYVPGVAFRSGVNINTFYGKDRKGKSGTDRAKINPLDITYSDKDISITYNNSGEINTNSLGKEDAHDWSLLFVLNSLSDSVHTVADRSKFLFPVFIAVDEGSEDGGDGNNNLPGIFCTDELYGNKANSDDIFIPNTHYDDKDLVRFETATMKSNAYNVFGGFLGAALEDKSIILDYSHIVSSKRNGVRMSFGGRYKPVYGNIFQYYARFVLGMLTSIYFKSEKLETRKVIVKDKYTYYSPHVDSFVLDIIVLSENPTFKFKKVNEHDEEGKLIYCVLDEYIEATKNIASKEGKLNKENLENNLDKTVIVKVNSCVKTWPLLFNINYILPDLQRLDLANTVIIKSYNSNYNGKIVNCSYGTLYTIDTGKEGDIELSPINSEYEFHLKDCGSDYIPTDIKSNLLGPITFKVPNLLLYLFIDNDTLKIKDSVDILNMNSKYNIRGHGDRRIYGLTKYEFFKFDRYNEINIL